LLDGIVGVQKQAVLAAKRAVVTVEECVDELQAPGLNAVILPAWTTSAIAVVPGGAYPSYAQGYYRRANGFYIAWDDISRDRTKFREWMRDNVLNSGPESFRKYRRAAS
jgi:glutaconate CoA-transferase subunit A